MPTFADLPLEIFDKTVGYLRTADQLRLSSTCSELRNLLAPKAFKSICASNDGRISRSALIAAEKYGQYTTSLRFTTRTCAGDNEQSHRARRTSTAAVLPQAATELLGGKHMPNLHTLAVHFDFDWDYDIIAFEQGENLENVEWAEETLVWRSMMNETWTALAANQTARQLTVKQFVPKWATTFATTKFQEFLGRLESASISVLGLENGAGWNVNTMDGYVQFLCGLGDVLFKHMRELKHLSLEAADEGPIGLDGFRQIPLPLRGSDMPVLQSLKLRNCFVGPELITFIKGHAKMLKSLELEDCVSGGDAFDMAENAMHWYEFFRNVRETKPILSNFVIRGKAPLTSKEQFGESDPGEDINADNILEIRRMLENDKNRKVFCYADIDSKYGMFFRCEEENIEAFERGDDQIEYDKLMKLVNKNAPDQYRKGESGSGCEA